MANSFGDVIDDATYYRQRFEDWRAEANKFRAENERLRTALEKIANTEGNLHPSWHVHAAREALDGPKDG